MGGAAMEEDPEERFVTPGDVLGKASNLIAGRGAYVAPSNQTIYASLTGRRHIVPPSSDSSDGRPTVEVAGHKSHGPVPEPGSVVIARVRFGLSLEFFLLNFFQVFNFPCFGCLYAFLKTTLGSRGIQWSPYGILLPVTKVMARTASADIMCVGPKSVREKFTGIIRQQDVRATEIDKVDMHLSFRPGDIVRAMVLSLGDARAYYLSTAKNELGVVSAESIAGATMVPISWTEMQCPLTGQVEQRKVAKAV